MNRPAFNRLRVLALESRRARELTSLIDTYGGQPMVVPALREVPLESNAAALDFAAGLLLDEFDIVVFLTGAGARALVEILGRVYPGEEIPNALRRTKIAVRGPKPAGVIRELKVPIWVTTPEPHTWRELVAAMVGQAAEQPLQGARIAVQEYGASNDELLEALRSRGASVAPVPVYRWALPDDPRPLEQAVSAICRGAVDVLLFTSSVQLTHLWHVVRLMDREIVFRRALETVIIGSIGPTTSREIRRLGVEPDIEASHPKLGVLVRDAAERAPLLLRTALRSPLSPPGRSGR
jgi:uroporphyrinogen-III synthase